MTGESLPARELAEQAAREMNGEPVPVTVVSAEWVITDADAPLAEWRLTAVTEPVIDGPLSLTVPVDPAADPATMSRMFRVLAVLGVPVPPPYGTEGFWEQGWDEHGAAGHMIGAKVMARRSRTGEWYITGPAA